MFHHDSAYSISPKAQQILNRKRHLTCDEASDPKDLDERVTDLEQHRRDHEDRMASMTQGLGDMRADIVDLRKSRDSHARRSSIGIRTIST